MNNFRAYFDIVQLLVAGIVVIIVGSVIMAPFAGPADITKIILGSGITVIGLALIAYAIKRIIALKNNKK